MGVVKNLVAKAGNKVGDGVAKLSSLSPEQVEHIQLKRDEYLTAMPNPNDETASELTSKLLAATSIEIYNAYLPQIKELYLPVSQSETSNRINNIRYLNINKWVTDKKENSIEKLVNVYSVLADEECNIALIFNRTCDTTNVYLAVSNTSKENNNVRVNDLIQRLESSLKGNFPGSEWANDIGKGTIPCLDNNLAYSTSCVSNIPAEKSEKFISQTIEKILDGVVPTSKSKEYTIVLLATPVHDLEDRKLALSEFYSGLTPYASWQTNYTFVENDSTSSMAILGVNAGVSAGIQNATNQALTNSSNVTDSTNTTDTKSTNNTITDTEGQTNTDNYSTTNTLSQNRAIGETITDTVSDSTTSTIGESVTDTLGTSKTANVTNLQPITDGQGGPLGMEDLIPRGLSKIIENSDDSVFQKISETMGGILTGEVNLPNVGLNTSTAYGESASEAIGKSVSEATTKGLSKAIGKSTTDTLGKAVATTTGKAIANSTSRSVANGVGRSLARSLGRAVSSGLSTTQGLTKAVNFGGNFGANFARSSNTTIAVGKNEGITQSFSNYNIVHALSRLEQQMKRYELSTALGMWDFAAYVLSEDHNVASSVAHSYMALTQGEESYMSSASINTWRGDVSNEKLRAQEICNYIRDLNHPLFALNPEKVVEDAENIFYPPLVTPTTSLSGKELAYSLNFPLHSVPGLPILRCAEFGRNIVSYDESLNDDRKLHLGKVFHMNHSEPVNVDLSADSLSSHVFITGSTGSGKSNTVYKILNEAINQDIKFLVVEPAKGEYKDVLGKGANVFGTNPYVTPLLKINPFKFPSEIHILEHLDRLVEIFNVCWPMYAAMPAVLKNAIERSYEDCGWDLIRSTNRYSSDYFPKFSDVTRNVKQIIESSEYDTENKGAYKGALITRLQSLTNGINGLIFCEEELDGTVLFDQNTIVDLSRVGSSETKSLIMGVLVLKLQEYRMANKSGMNSSLKHITVLEEAHNLLKRTVTEQPIDGGNLMGKSVEMLTNAIAEMRTYGEGFVIVDQAPGLLDLAVIRNTNTKIIMRLPDYEDRLLVGRAANLNEEQINEMAKLPCGVAAVYQNEWVQPILCKVDRVIPSDDRFCYSATEFDSDKTLSDTDRLNLAELLCNGVTVERETILKDIMPVLKENNVDASVQVAIIKMFENPTVDLKMTKLAPIVNALFPEVVEAVKTSYSESSEQKEWTQSANKILVDMYSDKISDRTRRDIIQSAMTYYLLNVLNKIDVLEEWSQNGGLS